MLESKTKRRLQVLLIGSIIIMLLFVSLNNENEKYDSRGLLNQQAPIFILQDINESEVEASDYYDKGVILNFWASWCTPCVNELPLLNEAYKMKDFNMLAINVGESSEKIKKFSERYELVFPILLDSDQKIKTLFAITALPMTIVINKEGTVIARYNGELTEMKQIFNLVERLY